MKNTFVKFLLKKIICIISIQVLQNFFIPSCYSNSLPADTINKPFYHILQPGENLITLSKLYGISEQDLKEWNQISNSKTFPYQLLILYNPDKLVFPANDHFYNPKLQPVVDPSKFKIIKKTTEAEPADIKKPDEKIIETKKEVNVETKKEVKEIKTVTTKIIKSVPSTKVDNDYSGRDKEIDKVLETKKIELDRKEKPLPEDPRANASSDQIKDMLQRLNYKPTVFSVSKDKKINIENATQNNNKTNTISAVKDKNQKQAEDRAIAELKRVEAEKVKAEEEKIKAENARLAKIKLDSLNRIKNLREKIKKEKFRADSLILAKIETEKKIREKIKADSLILVKKEREKIKKEKFRADSISLAKTKEEKLQREKIKTDSLTKVKAEKARMAKAKTDSLTKPEAGNKKPVTRNQKPVTGNQTPVDAVKKENVSSDDLSNLLNKMNYQKQKVQYTQQLGIQVSGEDDLSNDQLVRFAFFMDKDLIRSEERVFQSYVVGNKKTYDLPKKDSLSKPIIKESIKDTNQKPVTTQTVQKEEKGIALQMDGNDFDQTGFKIIYPSAIPGSEAKLTNPSNGKYITVIVFRNDFVLTQGGDYIMQVNKAVAGALGFKNKYTYIKINYSGK